MNVAKRTLNHWPAVWMISRAPVEAVAIVPTVVSNHPQLWKALLNPVSRIAADALTNRVEAQRDAAYLSDCCVCAVGNSKKS